MVILLLIIGIGAVVGFARSDGEGFSEKILSALGGAFIAILIGGAVVMIPNIGSGGSEGAGVSDYRSGR